MLTTLANLRRFYPKRFELQAVTVSLGFEGMDFSAVSKYCEALEVPYKVVESDIAEIVFDIRKEQNPCALCANLRRGALNDHAGRLGCNVVALGHHKDDVIETEGVVVEALPNATFKVKLPNIMPGVISGAVMAFTLSLDDFVISYFVSPSNFQTLPLLIYSMTKKTVKPDMYALSTLIIVTVFTLLILSNIKSFKKADKLKKKGGKR